MKENSVRSWLLAARPKTLTTAVIPIGVGTAAAHAIHHQSCIVLSVFAFLSALFIQIGTNLINDAFDFKKGADTAARVGPQRVTQSGLLSEKSVWWGGIACFGISVLFALPLVWVGGWPIIWTGVLSLAAGYAYTGGPFPLAYLGLGDLFVIFFFGWVAVGGVYFLHTGTLDFPVWVAGLQVGLLATVLIAINNLRDSLTDLQANKLTLAVRFGPTFARVELTFLCLTPFVLGWYWMDYGLKWAFILPLAVFPLALFLLLNLYRFGPGVIYNRFLGQGALLHLGFGILLSLGLVLK